MRLYHRTTRQAADAIILSGFRDASGFILAGASVDLVGVFVSDRPLTVNEGAKGDVLLRIDVTENLDELEIFGIVEDEKPYLEWCVPASLLNRGNVLEVEED
jgi:hypothetical protein